MVNIETNSIVIIAFVTGIIAGILVEMLIIFSIELIERERIENSNKCSVCGNYNLKKIMFCKYCGKKQF